MDLPRRLLWIDCLAGAVVGILMLSLRGWLSEWYQLPLDLLLIMGVANLTYATYSFSLAARKERPRSLILLLIVANLTWAVFCLRWLVVHFDTASVFGLLQLGLEAIFVGGLGGLEWYYREQLQTA